MHNEPINNFLHPNARSNKSDKHLQDNAADGLILGKKAFWRARLWEKSVCKISIKSQLDTR